MNVMPLKESILQIQWLLTIPPSLFATVIKGLGAAHLAEHARVLVEKPFGRDLSSARELNGIARSVFPFEDMKKSAAGP
jgi:glucose-6-phosphate 1-dehydrogenase